MLTVEVDFLAERFSATAFNDREQAEWPPHPARLYSAMVAAWADAEAPDPGEQAALRWFEALPPPTIACADEVHIMRRDVVTHFVPVNDARVLARDANALDRKLRQAEEQLAVAKGDRATDAAQRAVRKAQEKLRRDSIDAGRAGAGTTPGMVKTGLSVLPEHRVRQGRTFPTIRLPPHGLVVRYHWPTAELRETARDALDAVLARVGRLGHSSTPVSCRIAQSDSLELLKGQVHWVVSPDAFSARKHAGVHVRLPAPGSLDRLMSQFEYDEGSLPRTTPARFMRYEARTEKGERRALVSSILAGTWHVLEMRSGGRVKLTRTLDLTRSVRKALLSGSGDDPPYLLHGHEPSRSGAPTRPGSKPHLSVIPLPNVGHQHSDGTVHGVALVLPRSATVEEETVLRHALERWRSRSDLAGTLPLSMPGASFLLNDLGEDRWDPSDRSRGGVLARSFWTRPSSRWVSVTPIALDRYPGRPNDPDWEAHAGDTIAVACTHVGLPLPAEVEIVWGSPLAGVPPAGPRSVQGLQAGVRFAGFRTGTSDQSRLCVHARLRFSDPVAGPLVLGAGRFAGYGLCFPLTTGADE